MHGDDILFAHIARTFVESALIAEGQALHHAAVGTALWKRDIHLRVKDLVLGTDHKFFLA